MNKDFKKLQRDELKAYTRLDAFCKDFNIIESKKELYEIISEIINSNIKMESYCNL